MSSALYYDVKHPKTLVGDLVLKDALRKWPGLPCELSDSEHIGYLRGLVVCNVDGAQVLLDAIEQNGVVSVFEEW